MQIELDAVQLDDVLNDALEVAAGGGFLSLRSACSSC